MARCESRRGNGEVRPFGRRPQAQAWRRASWRALAEGQRAAASDTARERSRTTLPLDTPHPQTPCRGHARPADKTALDDPALPAARLLRGRRSRHPDRRAGAEEIRRAGLCPPRDRPQPLCGRGPADARRGLHRGTRRDPAEHRASPVVFSAHGVPKSVPADAQARNLFYLDATCPLVSKVHKQAMRHQRLGRHVLLIGHAGHPEVIGTMGQLPDGAVTLVETRGGRAPLRAGGSGSARLRHADDAVGRGHRRRHPRAAGAVSADLHAPAAESICYATTNRQEAVKETAAGADLFLVVGAPNSSNSHAAGRGRASAPARRCRCSCSAPPTSHGIDIGAIAHARPVGRRIGARDHRRRDHRRLPRSVST